MDQLYQETMERFYTIDAREPNDVSMPNDDAASSSSIVNQEFEMVDPTLGHQGPGPPDPRGQHRRFYPPAYGNHPAKTN